jgi:proteasome lid subunit RPN8/RPN11
MTSVSAYSEAPSLPRREPPLREGFFRRHGGEPGESEPVRIIVQPQALAEIEEHSNSQMASELGGVLLGRAYEHDEQTYVEIEAALPALSEDRGPFHFTFNADVWSVINRERETNFPGLQIVGWFHTHPGLGVFFSADDVVVHSAAFVMPWHVALVVDPLRGEAGFFGWVKDNVAPLSGCYELANGGETVTAAFPWRLVAARVWDETYEEHLAQRAGLVSEVRTAAPGWPSPGPLLILSVALGGIAIMFALLLVSVLPLYRQMQALQAAAEPLLEERLRWGAANGVATCSDPDVRIYAPAAGGTTTVPNGERLPIVGVANVPDSNRYQVELRPAGGDTWYELGRAGRTRSIGRLLAWDTTDFVAGEYELRLLPLTRQGNPLPGAADCTVRFGLAR